MCRVPESRSPGLFRTLNEWDRGYGEWTTEIGEDKKTPKNADPNVEQNVEQNVQPVRTWWKFWQWLGLWEKEPEKRNTARPRLAFLPSHHISKQLDSPWTQIPRIHAILRTVLIRSCCPCVSWCILMYLNVSWCILFNFLDRYWRKGNKTRLCWHMLTYVDCMSVQHYHRHHHEVLCQGFIISCGERLSPSAASSMFSSNLQYLTKFTAREGPFDLGCSTPARQDQDRIRRGSVLREGILRKHGSRNFKIWSSRDQSLMRSEFRSSVSLWGTLVEGPHHYSLTAACKWWFF